MDDKRLGGHNAVHQYGTEFRIEGVEIFGAGTHNGDTYTTSDLDQIVSAFNSLDFKPVIKAGHSDDGPGSPALGWVDNLRRAGDRLVADFVDLPKQVYDAISQRMYDRVSSEIWWDFKRSGKVFNRALKAVALLGQEVPAVAGLKPLREHFKFADDTAEKVVFYDEFKLKGSDMTPEQIKKLQDDAEAAEKARAEAEKKYADESAAKAALEAKIKEYEEKNKKAEDGSLETLLKRLSDSNGKIDAEVLVKTLHETEAKAKLLEEETAALKKRNEAQEALVKSLAADKRRNDIEAVVNTCRIPAFKVFVRQYLDLATRQENLRVYTEDHKEIPASQALESMIEWVNKNAAKLFTVHSKNDITERNPEDVGQEVDEKVKRHMTANPGSTYEQAMNKLFAEDPGLKERYARRYDVA